MKAFVRVRKVLRGGVFAFLLLAVRERVLAQYPVVGYSGKLPADVPADQLASEFFLGKSAQREELLRELGVDSRLAHDTANIVQESPIQVEALESRDASLLFLPCVGPGTSNAHIFLIRRRAQLGWRVVDEASLDCWGTEVTYELIFVPEQEGSLILVHHVSHGHGSGMRQDNMLLLGERSDHFVTLLDTAEFLSEEILDEEPEKTVEQRSTLQPFPDGSVEETRATTVREEVGQGERATERTRLTTIERRMWNWNKALQKFTAGKFTTAH